jgi:hypothetical protein
MRSLAPSRKDESIRPCCITAPPATTDNQRAKRKYHEIAITCKRIYLFFSRYRASRRPRAYIRVHRAHSATRVYTRVLENINRCARVVVAAVRSQRDHLISRKCVHVASIDETRYRRSRVSTVRVRGDCIRDNHESLRCIDGSLRRDLRKIKGNEGTVRAEEERLKNKRDERRVRAARG